MCELNSRMNRTRFPKQTNLRRFLHTLWLVMAAFCGNLIDPKWTKAIPECGHSKFVLEEIAVRERQ